MFYYTWPSLEFNHNVAQMPVWAALIYYFYLATKYNKWKDWIIFGVLSGIGMLTKYSVAFLIFTIVLFSFITSYRLMWLTVKPWVSIFIALIIFSPHVWWLYQHDWLTFTYIQARSNEVDNSYNPFVAFKYLLAQFTNFLPLIIILLCNKSLSIHKLNINQNDKFFILFIGLFPGVMLFIISLLTGVNIKDMWASPMWSLVALIFIAMIPDQVFQQRKRGLLKGLMIWLGVITIVMASYVQFGGQLRNKPSRMDWPQQEISLNVQKQWDALSDCQMDNLTGDNWLAILAATKMQNLPSVMMSTSEAYSPWMSLARLEQKGTFVLWEKGKKPFIPYLTEIQSNKDMQIQQGEWTIYWDKVPHKEPLIIQWQMFVPKQCVKS
ncbi:glycosyltransferase family 39 protein [Acinetobacter equi]|nr:glycosyltransferase family 39 protein [Acinetobacter equi]